MSHGYSMLGFIVIVILYAMIGLMAASGAISLTRKIFSPKGEQIFYAMFLIMIAALYLAFTASFGVATAWRLETGAVRPATAEAERGSAASVCPNQCYRLL
jgi:MFS-type transporter involved in bile tolerance (Atg22 family)